MQVGVHKVHPVIHAGQFVLERGGVEVVFEIMYNFL